MQPTIAIRPERPADVAAIRIVHERAFGRPGEAALVEALRAAGALVLSLVADQDGNAVGHVAFSPVRIEAPDAVREALGLAPMAVLPAQQRRGIGARLVAAGLARLRAAGHGAVIVLGHAEYYPRFDFMPADRYNLRWEHPCPPEAFMAIELRPGALSTHPAQGGVVRYRPEFAAL